MYQLKNFILIVVSIVAILVLNACNEGNLTQPEQDPPTIPPVTTFLMTFDDFDQGPLSKPVAETSSRLMEPQSNNNWLFATANVFIWQTIINVTLAVPAHSFMAAFLKDRTPEYKDGEWIWSYDFNCLAGLYHAELHGDIIGDQVEWAMYISKEGVYENFQWYTGTSKLTATQGTWTLNKEPQNPIPLLYIEWHRNPVDLTYDIKYTNVLEGSEDKGSYILNGVTDDTDYDAFYTIYNIKELNTTEIKWHRIAKYGRVKDSKHFGDDLWHCWDENGADVICED